MINAVPQTATNIYGLLLSMYIDPTRIIIGLTDKQKEDKVPSTFPFIWSGIICCIRILTFIFTLVTETPNKKSITQ